MKDHWGWRARIGLIYMAPSTVMDAEFWAMAPEGVTIHETRILLPKTTVEGLGQMMAPGTVEACTAALATAPLSVIIFGGSSATFLDGKGTDDAVTTRMVAVSNGIPVTATMTSVLKGLEAVGAKRVSLVTPYIAEVTERGRIFLAENRLDVLAASSMELDNSVAIGDVPLEKVYAFTRESVHPDSDAVYISCTNLRTIGAIEALERDLGIPVVSAVQASFWECLRIAGVGEPVEGFGRLLRM